MTTRMTARARAALAAALILTGTGPALAGGMLTAENGMTLYVFDKDSDGKSACYEECAANWPPYLAEAGEQRPAGWGQTTRDDGSTQWTAGGRPLYFFAGDAAPGDAKGEGLKGVWHTVQTR